MLRHFMNPARGRFDSLAIKMIQWHATFSNRVGILNGFGHIRFRQGRRFHQRPSPGKLRRDCRRQCATRPVRVIRLNFVPTENYNLVPIKKYIHRAFQMPALHNHRARAHLHQVSAPHLPYSPHL